MHTKHAKIRMKQRCISEHLVETLWTEGEVSFCRGAEIYTYHSRCEKGLSNKDDLAKLKRIYLVVIDGTLITCAYRNKNLRLH